MSLLLCLLQVYVDVDVSLDVIQCGFFYCCFHNGRPQHELRLLYDNSGKNMLQKLCMIGEKSGALKLALEGLITFFTAAVLT